MIPTLRAGDGLKVESYGGTSVSVGDVVVFMHPESDYHVVHRVVSVERDRVRTRGDNNNRIDPWFVNADDILGKVVMRHRGKTWEPVLNGWTGDLIARSHRVKKSCAEGLVWLFSPTYRLILRSKVTVHMTSGRIPFRVVRFEKPQGPEFKLLMGPHQVGRYANDQGKWEIRRPFRLFIDESTLPGLPGDSDGMDL